MFSAFKAKLSRIFQGSSQTSRTVRDTPIARLDRNDLIYRPFAPRNCKTISGIQSRKFYEFLGRWIFHHPGEISRLWVKVIAILIIQSFLIFDITWAAGTRDFFPCKQNDCLSPAINIQSSDFNGFFQQMLKNKLSQDASNIPGMIVLKTPKVDDLDGYREVIIKKAEENPVPWGDQKIIPVDSEGEELKQYIRTLSDGTKVLAIPFWPEMFENYDSDKNPYGRNLDASISEIFQKSHLFLAGTRGETNFITPHDTRKMRNTYEHFLTALALGVMIKIKYQKSPNEPLNVLIGHEVRVHSKIFETAMSQVFAGMGIITHVLPDSVPVAIWDISTLAKILKCPLSIVGTASHSPTFDCGTKFINMQGSQFSVNEIMTMTSIMKNIHEWIKQQAKEAEKTGNGKYYINIPLKNDPRITSELFGKTNNGIKIYEKYQRKTAADEFTLDLVRQLIQRVGLGRIHIDCMHGSGYRTLTAFFNEVGLNEVIKHIDWMHIEERDDFGGIGLSLEHPVTGKSGFYDLGADVTQLMEKEITMPDESKKLIAYFPVLCTADYRQKFSMMPVGDIVLPTDMDNDRLSILQILPNTKQTKDFLDSIGVFYNVVNAEKIVAQFIPNKGFHFIIDMNFKRLTTLMQQGKIDKNRTIVMLKTFASSPALDEYVEKKKKEGYKIEVVNTAVGFAKLANVMYKIEDAKRKKPGQDIVIDDGAGNKVNVGANPIILAAWEESGGIVTGITYGFEDISGDEFLAAREKSATESIFLTLALISNLQKEQGGKFVDLGRYLNNLYEKDEINTIYDIRFDNKLTTADGDARKYRIFGAYLSLYFALKNNKIKINDVRKILKDIFEQEYAQRNEKNEKLPAEMMQRFKNIDFSHLQDLWFTGDGVMFVFRKPNGEKWQILYRPSGTEPKTKAYGFGKDMGILKNYTSPFAFNVNVAGHLPQSFTKNKYLMQLWSKAEEIQGRQTVSGESMVLKANRMLAAWFDFGEVVDAEELAKTAPELFKKLQQKKLILEEKIPDNHIEEINKWLISQGIISKEESLSIHSDINLEHPPVMQELVNKLFRTLDESIYKELGVNKAEFLNRLENAQGVLPPSPGAPGSIDFYGQNEAKEWVSKHLDEVTLSVSIWNTTLGGRDEEEVKDLATVIIQRIPKEIDISRFFAEIAMASRFTTGDLVEYYWRIKKDIKDKFSEKNYVTRRKMAEKNPRELIIAILASVVTNDLFESGTGDLKDWSGKKEAIELFGVRKKEQQAKFLGWEEARIFTSCLSEWWKELFLNQKSKVLTDEERQFFQKYFGGSAGSPLTKKAEGFASKIAKLASFQGLSASKIASFLLDSVKAKNFILGLIKLSSLNGEQLLDKLENIKGLSSIISKFRLSQIDLNKTEIDEADKAILGDPFVTIKLDREAGDLGISLTQSPNTIVSKREKSIIEEHYAITRERMAERDKKHSPVHDPEEDLNYRGKVSEYYNRVFLTSVAKQMEDFVDIHFTNKGRKLGFIVKVGIGANEEYDHHTRAVYETKKNGIVYAVMNNSYEFEEFRKRHPDANGDNTLMIYESRSGETEEPLKVFLFNYKDFPVSIVFSNQGPLHDTAEGWIKKQQQKEEVPTILRLDFRTDMAGRYMRRKTPMSYCALHLLDEISRRPEVRITNSGEVKRIRQLVAEMKGVKDSSYAAGVIEAQIQTQEARLKHTYADRWAYKYMLVTDEADRLLSFTKKEESLAVQIAEFIHRNQMLSRLTPGGRDQIALIVNDEDILWPATEQPIQNWMEGVNKPGNKMIMAPYLFSEEPHAIQGILDQAGSHIALFVLNKKHPSYQEAKKKAQEMYAKGIPLVMIEINEPNIENTAGFSSLMEDFIVYYAGIIGQNPYTNPEVKYVRENSDTRLVVIGDEKRERLGQPAIPAVTKEEKAIKIKEVNPKDDALVSFVSMFDQIAEALSIDSKEAISAFEDNLDGELVINALAEANGVHRQTAVDGVNKTGEFHKIVKDYEEVMRKKEEMQKSKVDKSVFMDETKARQKAKQLGIEGIEFSLGPSDIAVDKEALEYLKKLYEEIRGDDSLAKRIAEFIHLSVSLLEQEGKRRDNIVLTTNDQYRLDFAKAFKEHWAYNISKLAKFIFGIDKLPRASHMVIEGRLGQADSHFNIIVLAEDLGLSKRQVLSNEDVEFSNPAHQGLDRNKALFGLALGNKDTILAKMPGIAIKVKEITPEMNLKLINLGREISKHYAEILRKISSSPFAAPVIESEGTFDVTYEDGIFLLTSEEKSMFQTMQAEQMIMQAI